MAYDLDEWKMILAPSALIICILWDIAFYVAKDCLNVKIHSWVPSNLFVLSALTIQILSYVDVEKVNVFGPSNEKDMQELVDNQLRLDAARLAMCVFVGCLLPGMATVGTVGRWSNVAALFLSLSFHIATQIYALQNVNNSIVQSEAGPWFMASGILLLLGALSLLLLLGAVILSGKLMRDVTRLDDIDVENQGDKWKMLRSEVMHSWVAARAWKAKYYACSSFFSPGAGMIVTICVSVMAAKVGCRSSLLHHKNGGGNLTFYLQCMFILVGWILMLCRWFKAALYCQNLIGGDLLGEVAGTFIMATSIVVRPLQLRLEDFSIREFKFRDILISVSCFVPVLVLCVLVLAISLLLLFCFICWYFSDLLFGGQFVQHLFKLDKKADSAKDAFFEFSSILDDMDFGEDNQRTFWILNKKSFNRIEGRMEEANQNAKESCTILHSIMGNNGLDQNQRLRKANSKQSWMGVLSFIFTELRFLGISVNMEDAFKAYWETHDVLKFVHCPDNIVVDPLNFSGTLNIKALMDTKQREDSILDAERNLKQGLGTSLEEKRELTTEERKRVDNLLRSLKELGEIMFKGHLVRVDATSCDTMEELGKILRTVVGHVIVSCLLEAPDVIVKYTRQWAQNLNEGKIEAAIELAGKVSGLLEKLVKDGDIRLAAETGEVEGQSAPKGEDLEAANCGQLSLSGM